MFFFVLCLVLDRTRAPRFDLVVVLQSMPDVSLQHCLKLLSSKGGWVLAMHRSPFALPLLPVSCCKALPTPRTSFHNQAVLLGIDKDHPAFRTRFVRQCCMVWHAAAVMNLARLGQLALLRDRLSALLLARARKAFFIFKKGKVLMATPS